MMSLNIMCFEHMASEAGEVNCFKHAYCKESWTACSLLSVMLFISVQLCLSDFFVGEGRGVEGDVH